MSQSIKRILVTHLVSMIHRQTNILLPFHRTRSRHHATVEQLQRVRRAAHLNIRPHHNVSRNIQRQLHHLLHTGRIGPQRHAHFPVQRLEFGRIEAHADIHLPVPDKRVANLALDNLRNVLRMGAGDLLVVTADVLQRLRVLHIQTRQIRRFSVVSQREIEENLVVLAEAEDISAVGVRGKTEDGGNFQVAFADVIVPAVLVEFDVEHFGRVGLIEDGVIVDEGQCCSFPGEHGVVLQQRIRQLEQNWTQNIPARKKKQNNSWKNGERQNWKKRGSPELEKTRTARIRKNEERQN